MTPMEPPPPPDLLACDAVEAAYNDRVGALDCPDVPALEDCPYLNRPCEWYSASTIAPQIRGARDCESFTRYMRSLCPPGGNTPWPPPDGSVPCCAR